MPASEALTVPDLSVVIPAYNESDRLHSTMTQLLGHLAPQERSFEVVVVDDGSVDATASIVRDFSLLDSRIRLLRHERNRGKGCAVRTGVLAAAGERVLVADADGATPISQLARLDAALDAGYDVAIGSRALAGAADHVKTVWYRKAIGRVFSFLVKMLVVGGFADTQCGFKLFRRSAAGVLFKAQRLDGYAFDVEVLYLARRLGLKVDEILLDWTNQPGSKVNLVIDPARMFVDLLRIRCWGASGRYPLTLPSQAVSTDGAVNDLGPDDIVAAGSE